MKLRTILASSLLVATTFSANAEGFLDTIKNAFGFGDKEVTEQVQTVAEANTVVEDIKESKDEIAKSFIAWLKNLLNENDLEEVYKKIKED